MHLVAIKLSQRKLADRALTYSAVKSQLGNKSSFPLWSVFWKWSKSSATTKTSISQRKNISSTSSNKVFFFFNFLCRQQNEIIFRNRHSFKTSNVTPDFRSENTLVWSTADTWRNKAHQTTFRHTNIRKLTSTIALLLQQVNMPLNAKPNLLT